MELTREEIENIANGFGYKYRNNICETMMIIAQQLLREMIEEKVWQNAPKEATRAHVNYFAGKQILQEYKSNWYERPLPKSTEREIAEKWATEGCNYCKEVADKIESALNEYKEREK